MSTVARLCRYTLANRMTARLIWTAVVVIILVAARAAPHAAAAVNVVVKPSALNGWGFYEEVASATGSFVVGPAPAPLGNGSARMTLDATGRELLGTFAYAGVRLDQISVLQYSTYRSSADAGNNLAISLQLDMDYDLTDANTAWQGRLVFEPYLTPGVGGAVLQNTWQTWDALAGEWWSSGAPGNGVCPQANPCTWTEVLTAFPNAGVRAGGAVQFKAGGPWPNFDGNVDAFTIKAGGNEVTYDFEPETPCTAICYADAVNGDDAFGGDTPASAKKTIQAAIDAVQPGGQVRVLPGTYSETATNRWVLGTNGPHQFGLFIAKNGVTVMGVDASDAPITSYAGVLATVNTNATNNFGYSGVFIEGDGVTIQGLRIGPNTAGDNKTIEIIGDAFTLRDSHVAVPDGGSVYFNDWRYTGSGPSHIQSYTIEANWLDAGASIDLTSGAGLSGPVSGRQITGNTFTDQSGQNWATISFNGSGTGVPWFVYSVGGAVIQNNTFTRLSTVAGPGAAHIRARGDYDNSQFDWTSYWNDNSFNKATVALVGAYPPFDVRTYSYTSGAYTFNHVRRIGALIQSEVDYAQAGDTVLVKPGSYPEQVTVNKDLALVGEAGRLATFIQAPATIPAASDPNSAIVLVTGAGVEAEITGFTIAGPGPSGCGSLAYGLFVRDGAHADIHDNRFLDIRDQPFSGCQNGVAIQVGRAALSTSGTAEITNNLIEAYQKNGITVSHTGSDAAITGNTVTGAGPTAVIAQNGIQVSGGATATISGNTVGRHSYTPFAYVSTGLLLYGAGTVDTLNNTVSENQVGIYIIETNGVHDGNVISASGAGTGSPGFWGLVVDAPPPAHVPSPLEDAPAAETTATFETLMTAEALASFSISSASVQQVIVINNELTGDSSAAGIGLEADAGFGASDIDLTAQNNYIRDWGTGVVLYQCTSNCTGTVFANVDLNLNSLSGNLAGVDNLSPFPLDAERNWWGSSTGPSGAGPGSGDSVSAGADFTPWLCTGVDTSPAVGFQPDLTTVCGVATQLVFTTQPGDGTEAMTLPIQPVVQAQDSYGNVDVNFSGPVTLALGANPGGATLGGTATVNAIAGVAAYTDLSVSTVGFGYTLVATSPGLAPAVSQPFNIRDMGLVCSPVLDNFDRRDGKLGSNWRGDTGGYSIRSKQVQVFGGGPIYWMKGGAASVYGADQKVCLTLTGVVLAGGDHAVMLKVQGGSSPHWNKGVIDVSYLPSGGYVSVDTYQPGNPGPFNGWFHAAPMPATFAAGDVLGARALADGTVRVYKNGVLIGVMDTKSAHGNFFVNKGGRLGICYRDAASARFDNFAGGNAP